jgi:hypothetical protein
LKCKYKEGRKERNKEGGMEGKKGKGGNDGRKGGMEDRSQSFKCIRQMWWPYETSAHMH